MTFIARRMTFVLILTFALVAAACGGGGSKAAPAGTTTTSAASTTSSTTTAAPPTTAPSDAWLAVWPTAESGERYTDPGVAARTFATSYLHFVAPIVGAFQQGDAHSGEVPIRAKSIGPVTTIMLRQLGTDGSWSVLGAATPNIELTRPAALSTISSPVRLSGSSRAFEATVSVSIREDGGSKSLFEGYVMGGSLQMGPFDSTFHFATPTAKYGAIVLFTVSPEDGHVSEATVIRVRYSPV